MNDTVIHGAKGGVTISDPKIACYMNCTNRPYVVRELWISWAGPATLLELWYSKPDQPRCLQLAEFPLWPGTATKPFAEIHELFRPFVVGINDSVVADAKIEGSLLISLRGEHGLVTMVGAEK